MSLTKALTEVVSQRDMNFNPIAMRIIQQVLEYDSFLGIIPSISVQGTRLGPYRKEASTVTVQRTEVGEDITESYATHTLESTDCGTFMTQIPMNVKVQSSHTTIGAWTNQLLSNSFELDRAVKNSIINDESTASDADFDGLRVLADNATGQTMTSSVAAGDDLTLAKLMQLRNMVPYPLDYFLMHPNTAVDFYTLGMSLGGNRWSDIQVPYAAVGANGQLEIKGRSVKAFDGVPIYESEYMGTETLNGEANKYRIIAGTFAPGRGLTTFYPESTANRSSVLGFSMDPMKSKENTDDDYIRTRWYLGMALYDDKAIAQITNLKYTNAPA